MKKKIIFGILSLFIIGTLGCTKLKSSGIQGISIFNKDKNIIIEYIPENKVHLEDLIGGEISNQVAVIREDGSVKLLSSNIYLDRDNWSVFLIGQDKKKIKDVKGIYLSNEYYSNGQAYYDAIDYLEKDEKIMVVLLDGFSYEQYKDAEEKGLVNFLKPYFIRQALSVYTPVTNAGFAAIITGQTPDVNGIHNRDYREMKVASIFDYTNKNDKKAILIEADIKILNTEIEPELNLDLNKDGDIDDEIYHRAIEASKEDYDLIFIHFHGIDDRGHSHGPYSQESMKYIEKIDEYLKDISEVWNGPMIVCSDHGMHEEEDRGNHGKCIYEDMVIPYFHKES